MEIEEASRPKAESPSETIERRICKTVGPGSWRVDEKGPGTIYGIGGLLVVNQTPRRHDALGAFIIKLRAEK